MGHAEELGIASLRRDGSHSNRRTIRVVRLGDDLYVRSANGPGCQRVSRRPSTRARSCTT
ncbi:DUF2255 family protein [Streptomyces cellostaticus]|uniref:DUF2255 family protein n=1 Tax=Streptomyces cellostaticus TaxID=67285 RepID=UPI00244668C9|nr:DUF2255 family protein [Streptomyces cellostaticus]